MVFGRSETANVKVHCFPRRPLVEKRSKRAATTDREAVRSAALSKVAAKKRYVKAGLDDKRKAKAARRSGGGGGGGDGDD